MRAQVLVLLALIIVFRSFAATNESTTASPASLPFESDFHAFEAADRTNSTFRGGVLFVGSSIFRQWTNVAEMMAPLPVLNRAFGGSRTGDQLLRFDQAVLPYAPKIIVYYCGSNDLKAGDAPEAIFERFKSFSQRVQKALPKARLLFVSSTRAPDRIAKWEPVNRYNRLVSEYCTAAPNHTFIDVNPVLFDQNGNPRLELYQADQLHLLQGGYSEFCRIIKPVIFRTWHGINGSEILP